MKSPIIYHIPHASVRIPEPYRKDYLVDLSHELLEMTDLYTDELFTLPGERLVFPVSRIVCDVERFRNDEEECMACIGMGAVYTVNHQLLPLRKVSPPEKQEILQNWYDPHHKRFTQMVSQSLSFFGRCLIIDCHSFPAEPLPYELDQNPNRPDICIGTDAFHSPEALVSAMESALSDVGFCVCRNRPFSGSIVPSACYRTDQRVASVMIEVNRRLYLDAESKKSPRFREIQQKLSAALLSALSAQGWI